MDYDKILLKIFLTNSGRSKYVLKKLNNYPNIKEYLDNRFYDYSESHFKEVWTLDEGKKFIDKLGQ